jgi:integrase/recombinase XerD
MESVAADFYSFLENEKKMKANTVLSYKRDIKAYIEHINDFSTSISLIPNYFESYINMLKQDGKSESTISRNIASLRNFFKFLMSRQLICTDPTCGHKNTKISKNNILNENLLTITEINAIISAATGDNFKGYRDRAILETLYACGLKASELLNIRLSDMHLPDDYITIASDDKTRYTPLYKDAIIAINKYIKKARNKLKNIDNDFLFLNKDGKPLTRQSLWKILKAYGKKAKIDKEITPHLFRQSMAMHLIENGAEVNDLQNLLGHKHISLTKNYVKHFKPNIISIYNKIHPKA